MKKFLFATQPSNDLGLLAQSLPIARALRDRGNTIAFCSPAKAPNKVIADAGFINCIPHWPVYSLIAGDDSFMSYCRLLFSKHLFRDLNILASLAKHLKDFGTNEIWNIDHFMHLTGMWNEKNIRLTVDALVQLISKNKPDVVVNFWNPYLSIAARICQKPLVSVLQADVHPQSKGFIWWKEPIAALPDPVPIVNTILDEYALQRIHKTGDLFVGDLSLVLGMPETDPLPERVQSHYIGAILWESQNAKLPDWICSLSSDRPVVWVYPGNPNYFRGTESPFDSGVILHACIEALKNLNVQVILTTGHHPLPKSALPLPANFRHAPYVPGIAMAKRSDLLIHHGGYGSCQTGLLTGTPAVIIPTYSERESNARRIAALGAGEFVLPSTDASGRKKKVNAGELRVKIERVLADPSYRKNAKKISERMGKYGGATEAARIIENFITDHAQSRPGAK